MKTNCSHGFSKIILLVIFLLILVAASFFIFKDKLPFSLSLGEDGLSCASPKSIYSSFGPEILGSGEWKELPKSQLIKWKRKTGEPFVDLEVDGHNSISISLPNKNVQPVGELVNAGIVKKFEGKGFSLVSSDSLYGFKKNNLLYTFEVVAANDQSASKIVIACGKVKNSFYDGLYDQIIPVIHVGEANHLSIFKTYEERYMEVAIYPASGPVIGVGLIKENGVFRKYWDRVAPDASGFPLPICQLLDGKGLALGRDCLDSKTLKPRKVE